MRTTIGKALLDSLGDVDALADKARRRAAILDETTNANCGMDSLRFTALADAIDALKGE